MTTRYLFKVHMAQASSVTAVSKSRFRSLVTLLSCCAIAEEHQQLYVSRLKTAQKAGCMSGPLGEVDLSFANRKIKRSSSREGKS
jgi:hypothetical protein